MDNLVLHVGLPKTGTTLLQKALNASRDRFTARGYDVLVRHEFDTLTGRKHRRWRLGNAPFETLREGFAAVAAASEAPGLVISHEDMLGSLACFRRDDGAYPDAVPVIRLLREVLGPRRTTVLVYLRRQDRFIESVYLQLVRMGAVTITFEEFFAQVRPEALRWDDLVERVRSALGPDDDLQVRYFESISTLQARGFCQEFFDGLGTGVTPALSFNTDGVNRGYSEVAMDVALTANPHLPPPARRELRAFLDAHLSNITHPKPRLLEEEQRTELLDLLRGSNERLHDVVSEAGAGASPYLTPTQGPPGSARPVAVERS
ncbi:hypothetical protein [Serinicoccus kebangsaanensis]|uniref:hypothetical protein n=1 Tax=Serinicoccus kebangsaanensis TaxID=2602069 RepID=UPI00124C5F85|nr:hypothetical protein [Serinicoccus kebangsaanensis]